MFMNIWALLISPPSPAPSSLLEGRGRHSGGSMVPWGISKGGRDEGRGASASCVFPATNGEEEKETLSHSNFSCLQGRNEEKEIGQFERLGKKERKLWRKLFLFLLCGDEMAFTPRLGNPYAFCMYRPPPLDPTAKPTQPRCRSQKSPHLPLGQYPFPYLYGSPSPPVSDRLWPI